MEIFVPGKRMNLLISTLFFVAIAFATEESPEKPTLLPLEWFKAGNSYASGKSLNRVVDIGDLRLPYVYDQAHLDSKTENARLIIDADRKVMLLDMGSGGIYHINTERSLIKIDQAPCAIANFTWDTQDFEYATAVQTLESSVKGYGKLNFYTGLNRDVGSCQYDIAVDIGQDKDGLIRFWKWTHPWIIEHPITKQKVWATISGSVWFENAFKIQGPVPDCLFEMPEDCATTTIDYCEYHFAGAPLRY